MLKKILVLALALITMFSMLAVSTSAASSNVAAVSVEELVRDQIVDSADVIAQGVQSVVAPQSVNQSNAVKVSFFNKIKFWFETTFAKNYKIGNEQKLAYAAGKGGDQWWTLSNNITVSDEIAVTANKQLNISGWYNNQRHGITRKNGGDSDAIFKVNNSKKLYMYRVDLVSESGRGFTVESGASLTFDQSSLKAPGDGINNSGYTWVEGDVSITGRKTNRSCIYNAKSGTVKLWGTHFDYMRNDGVIEMPKDHFADIKNVVTTSGSKIKMEAGHIGTLTYPAGQLDNILTKTGGTIDKYDPPISSTLKINVTSAPKKINCGSIFNIEGTVSSNYKITEVGGSIDSYDWIYDWDNTMTYTYNWNTVQSKSIYPKAYSVDLKSSNVNIALKFNELSTGKFRLRLWAKTDSGTYKTWSQEFIVVPTGWYAPILSKGNGYPSLNCVLQWLLKYHNVGFTSYVTGNFGDQTYAAVKEFQKRNGLAQTGVVNKATWEKLFVIVKPGDSNYAVSAAQQLLASLYYFPEDNGYFGSATEKAVRQFQKNQGYLTIDGKVGQETWKALVEFRAIDVDYFMGPWDG